MSECVLWAWAAAYREPGQDRKVAAISGHCRVPESTGRIYNRSSQPAIRTSDLHSEDARRHGALRDMAAWHTTHFTENIDLTPLTT